VSVGREIVEAPAAPAAIGPYGDEVRSAGLLGAQVEMDAIVAL
jgi:hypothetical protein